MNQRLASKLPALLALALPVLAGFAYLAQLGAPQAYVQINGTALAAGLMTIILLPASLAYGARTARIIAITCLILLALPLLIGPQINSITRWIELGTVTLHAGMFTLPLLVRMAAQDRDYGHVILLAALLLTLMQPDAASTFAITIAAVGLHHVTRDWRIGLVAIAGFFTTLIAGLRGELPAQPFVERVLLHAASESLALTLALFAALVACFLLMLFALRMTRAERFALAGSLFGYGVMAAINNYPSPMIGFGAAPILGYGIALAWPERNQA